MQSMSHTKKSIKHSVDNRTTKTKASATKPQLFGISLTRNKNNPNPALFNSLKKKKSFILQQASQNHQYQSEKKLQNTIKQQPTLLEDLHTRVSIDYINSLHSDLLVQFGYQLQTHFQDKQNRISARNPLINLPSKQQRQCLNQVRDLIELKQQIDQSYKCMQNTQNLFHYLANQSKQQNIQINLRKTHKIDNLNKQISHFLTNFEAKQKQIEILEKNYKDYIENQPQQEEKPQQEIDQTHLDSLIQSLKQEIGNEKRLCLRYEKEEKYLMNKMYFTQKKNNDLKASSTNLQMYFQDKQRKNTNLRDTIQLKDRKQTDKQLKQPRLHKSFSTKLQRIKKYNLENECELMNETETKVKKIVRSKSVSSLESLSKGPYLPKIKKESFLDRIQ